LFIIMADLSGASSVTDSAHLEKGPEPSAEVAAEQVVPANEPKPAATHDSPEGGTKAWLTVAGASAALFVSFGWVNCIGLFQAQYEAHQLKNYTNSQVSWITSMECTFICLLSP
jgi:hypothetical protein